LGREIRETANREIREIRERDNREIKEIREKDFACQRFPRSHLISLISQISL
jgi:hypothetical protein